MFQPHRGPCQSEEENGAAVTEYIRTTRVMIYMAIEREWEGLT